MANILVLTTDLPFFPGKMGVDFFNLRFLARNNLVSIVAPRYDSYPAAGVENLAKSVQELRLWPDPAGPACLIIQQHAATALPRWIEGLPEGFRRRVLFQVLGIAGQPDDAHLRLAILANCAPHLLNAIHARRWQAIVLIQSSVAPWLEYLPRAGAKVFYFHDVRCDYLARSTEPHSRKLLGAVLAQERQAAAAAEAIGFVSNLDLERARRFLPLPPVTMVAPIPVDTDYYVPAPANWTKAPGKTVLFTGHLRHPPNVDAVLYFLQSIWPLVNRAMPEARFQAVGLTPDPRLDVAIKAAHNAELHANVPDIRPYFWNADVYVVPMRYGGGVRQKIFEAWAMHTLVVSTTMGAEGTGAVSGENCWLEDTPEAMATRLVQVLKQGLSADIVQAAGNFVRQQNSIPVAAASFERLVHAGSAHRRQHPYKLLYDLRWMEIGKAGGTEQMTHELLHAISRIDHRNHYRTYVPRRTYHEWDLQPGFTCEPHFSDPLEKSHEALRASATNRLAESLALPAVLTPEMRTLRAWRTMDFDLVHSMVGYIHPDLECFPHIVTALDLQHIHFPEFFSAQDWQTRDKLYRESAAKAEHIICISEYTRQDMHRHYQVPLEKMTTIWLIPSRQVWTPPADATIQRLLAGMGVQGPYLYFPAHCWPHKNHAKLIEAFALILPHIPGDMLLIFSGGPFPATHPAHELIRQHGLENRVKHLGYRSSIEVQALLHGCFALVFPSLFEGFGIPVMDAIIAGKPIACSNCTSLPEIAGDAALTFDPRNIHDIGGRLLEIINDPARRAALLEAGRKRRPLFSARLSAVKTLAVYQEVHDKIYRP